jgi:hypothetical protein
MRTLGRMSRCEAAQVGFLVSLCVALGGANRGRCSRHSLLGGQSQPIPGLSGETAFLINLWPWPCPPRFLFS